MRQSIENSGLGEDQDVKAVVIEERVSHADLGEGGTHQVLAVTQVSFVVDPPVDDSLPIERRVIAIDVLGDRPSHIAAVPHARLGCGAVGAGVDVQLMAGDIVGMSLRRLG